MTRDEATLQDMLRAARLVVQFSEEVEDFDAFAASALVQSAVLHQLMVLGEAAKRLSEAFTAQHPEIPWSDIARTRDRLIHGYDTVDLSIVWTTVIRDVPDLLKRLEPLLP